MLQTHNRRPAAETPGAYAASYDQQSAGSFNWFRLGRQVHLIALSLIASLVLGVAYISLRPPSYTAVAQLLIDHKVIQLMAQNTMFAASGVGDALLQNQLAILQSEVISRKVIENLNLIEEKQFQPQSSGLLGRAANAWQTLSGLVPLGLGYASSILGPPAEEAPPSPESEEADRNGAIDIALDIFKQNLSAGAAGRDYTVDIKFTAPDPDSAARITNEITRVYLEDQVETNRRAAEAASAWLRGRIAELGTSARVLTEARPPRDPSGLSNRIVLAGSVLVGLLLGFAAAFARELSDHRIRLPDEAVAVTGTDYLGSLPRMKNRSRRTRIGEGEPRASASEEDSVQWQDNDAARTDIDRGAQSEVKKRSRRASLEDGGEPVNTERQRIIQWQDSAFSWAPDYPLSRLTHTINRIGIAAADAAVSGAVPIPTLGVTSTAPGEGRTVVAANLARVMAKSGQRVLLIDAVPYNTTLSRSFSATKPGLLEVLKKEVLLADAIYVDPTTGMHLLPLAVDAERESVSHLIWSNAMERLLLQGKRYDYIIFDLPPLGPVADVAASARFIDKFVLVMEWERMTPDVVLKTLASAGSVQDKLLGVVLNKVRTSRWQAFIDREISQGRAFGQYISESTTSKRA